MLIEDISTEKLSEITELLKLHVPGWPKLLSDKMSTDKDWKKQINKDCSESTVYNISGGIVKSQFRRRIFIKHASAALGTEASKANLILDDMNSIIDKK